MVKGLSRRANMTQQNALGEHDLSEEQRILKFFAARFFNTECPPGKIKELIETDQPYSLELWMKMAEQGYLGLLLPEYSGGLASGLMELAIISEQMGKACLPGPFISDLWGSCAIERASTGTQRGELLAKIVKGVTRVTVAFLLKEGVGTPAPADLKAKKEGEGYFFNGESIWIMDGEYADHLLMTARDPGRQSVLAVIPLDSPGLTLTRVPGLDPLGPYYFVRCYNVPVAEEKLLAFGPRAESAMAYATSVATLAATAEMIGSMQWILEAVMEFTGIREQMGQAIDAFIDISPRSADLLASVEKCRSAVYLAAKALQQSEPDAVEAVSLARRHTAETSSELGTLLLQRQEGMGLTWEHDLHLFHSVPPFFSSIL
jgi:alkylation response protein AidB-like acyl-CoA dehydrogenase